MANMQNTIWFRRESGHHLYIQCVCNKIQSSQFTCVVQVSFAWMKRPSILGCVYTWTYKNILPIGLITCTHMHVCTHTEHVCAPAPFLLSLWGVSWASSWYVESLHNLLFYSSHLLEMCSRRCKSIHVARGTLKLQYYKNSVWEYCTVHTRFMEVGCFSKQLSCRLLCLSFSLPILCLPLLSPYTTSITLLQHPNIPYTTILTNKTRYTQAVIFKETYACYMYIHIHVLLFPLTVLIHCVVFYCFGSLIDMYCSSNTCIQCTCSVFSWGVSWPRGPNRAASCWSIASFTSLPSAQRSRCLIPPVQVGL